MTVSGVQLGGDPALPLLVLGPSIGTTAATLWSAAAEYLGRDFHVVAWDLPGHGTNRAPVEEPLTMADLAASVIALVDSLGDGHDRQTFHYAGDSVGGAVGLQLMLDAPYRLASAILLCTGARFSDPQHWRDRMEVVSDSGTPALVAGAADRWFGTGFLEREPARASALLHALSEADDAGYMAICGALAEFDVRDRLGEVTTPVLVVAGAQDRATPLPVVEQVGSGVVHGRLVVLEGVAHLAPIEAPAEVAGLIRQHALGDPARDGMTVADVREVGLAVRREVLGEAHVARAEQATTDLTRDFQQFITEYAWGGIWTRPGLDRRSRSLVTLTALVANGHHEELAMHLRAARTNGVTMGEIKEVLLQTAVYCGVPAANTAFRIAQQVLGDGGEDQ